MGVFQRHLRAGKAEELIGVRYQLIHALGVMYSRHAGSVAAHRRKRQRSRGPTHPVRQADVDSIAHLPFGCQSIAVKKNMGEPHGLGAIL